MSALRGGIPRALPSHRSAEGWAYGAYCRAMVGRLGPLGAEARPWLREAGLLTLALVRVHAEAEALRQALQNGASRRARDEGRVQLRQLERRAARLRGALAATEGRLEALAGERRPLSPAEQLEAANRAIAEDLARDDD